MPGRAPPSRPPPPPSQKDVVVNSNPSSSHSSQQLQVPVTNSPTTTTASLSNHSGHSNSLSIPSNVVQQKTGEKISFSGILEQIRFNFSFFYYCIFVSVFDSSAPLDKLYFLISEIHLNTYNHEENSQALFDGGFLNLITKRLTNEISTFGGILAPINPSKSSNPYTLADEPYSALLTSKPPSNTFQLQVYFFLVFYEFFLTIAHIPTTSSTLIQSLVESQVVILICTAILSLTHATSLQTLSGKTGSSGPTTLKRNQLISDSFVSLSTPTIISSSSQKLSPSTTPQSLSTILSSVYHSFGYACLSALFNIFKNIEYKSLSPLLEPLNISSPIICAGVKPDYSHVTLFSCLLGLIQKVFTFFNVTVSTKSAVNVFALASSSATPTLSNNLIPGFLILAASIIDEIAVTGFKSGDKSKENSCRYLLFSEVSYPENQKLTTVFSEAIISTCLNVFKTVNTSIYSFSQPYDQNLTVGNSSGSLFSSLIVFRPLLFYLSCGIGFLFKSLALPQTFSDIFTILREALVVRNSSAESNIMISPFLFFDTFTGSFKFPEGTDKVTGFEVEDIRLKSLNTLIGLSENTGLIIDFTYYYYCFFQRTMI
jgi:hypothetical protein